MPNLYVALLHYPVENKNGQTIVSAVTNLDLHDIARTSATYGIKRFYVVTPDEEQAQLAEKIISHWETGFGATYNVDRKKALSLVKVVDSLDVVQAEIEEEAGEKATTIATSAHKSNNSLSFESVRKEIQSPKPVLVLFGTAWGLTRECLQSADVILAPINGTTEYNHLSVRSAVAIIIDRLIGTL